MFARHEVENFDAWKAAYDAFDEERTSMGVTGHGVYQMDGDPRQVTIYHHFDSMDAAKKFADSARLKEVMSKAGVVGSPEIWFATKV
jgi:hypothetical protein